MSLDLVNVINIQVSQAPVGLGAYNVNNLALFTADQFLSNDDDDTYRIYESAYQVGVDFGTTSETYMQAVAVFSQRPNILAGGGQLIIFPLLTTPSLETLAAAITRCKDKTFFCGIISTTYPDSGTMLAVSNAVQAYGDKILFLPSNDTALIAGAFTNIKNAGNTNTRCLLYTTSAQKARLMAAAYAGRGMSVNFSGSLTAITMNLKELTTVEPDAGITQTIYGNCLTAGVDVYTSVSGVSAVMSSGANKYFDNIYNLTAFVLALKVSGFNALRQLGTKIPQTEEGVSILKGAYRSVCEQFRSNGYIAPGSWTSSETFGDQANFLNNITERGYYIYTIPVSLQSTSDRQLRKGPLCQIAVKEAGAVHSSAVLVSVNP